MTYQEVLENARTCVGPYCKACPVCDGRACRNQIPGPGAKGTGDVAIRNYQKWQEIRVSLDTICENRPVDAGLELFGRKFRYPIFAGPVSGVNLHYGDKHTDVSYNQELVYACAKAGIAAFTGDGVNPALMEAAARAIQENGGMGVPTIKPWDADTVREKIGLARDSHAFAAAMDIDASGLPFLKNRIPQAGRKTTEELAEIIKDAGVPFIVKGIMTVKGAMKAKEAGASAIVVSNHGGRVLDQCPASAEVLEEIVDAVDGSMKILVDGGIRTGVDVFKALALGADGVIICRPFVTALFGGGEEGVKLYVEKIGAELEDTMAMCGANSLAEISRDMVCLF
ncbi:MAG: alpha-hydroxy-acid oxidizing protein [Lachnospiraceae bacterium]|nr:alpha-hydroxy-acid oxidizing protein [Lachnospiraceae bacterium]